jgi:hypothetical protein
MCVVASVMPDVDPNNALLPLCDPRIRYKYGHCHNKVTGAYEVE